MIRFLIKGLIRDRSRSLFPVIMVASGVAMTVLMQAWVTGAFDGMFETASFFDSGHVKIVTRAYKKEEDKAPNDLGVIDLEDTLGRLKKEYPEMIWTPRTKFGGLLDIPDENGDTRSQGPAMGLGVDLFSPDSPEKRILNLEGALVAGRYPSGPGEILISREFADKLGVKIGEQATLMGSSVMGAMVFHNFTVAGTVDFGIMAMDRGSFIADISDVQYMLDMEDSAGEILGFNKDLVYLDEAMITLKEDFNANNTDEDNEYSLQAFAMTDDEFLGMYFNMGKIYSAVVIFIFICAMGLVLWNSGLLNGIRRYGEIGIRIAVGESKNKLYLRMIIESMCIGIAGSLLGTFLGLVFAYYLQVKGLDISAMMQKSTIMMQNVFRAKITPACLYIGFIPGVIASVIGTVFSGIGIYRRDTSKLFKELEV
jgi:putative ABC transport system permease protein